ncbi:MAG: M14 family zinc carboxypeptidase [Hominisplanchenecus sp.]
MIVFGKNYTSGELCEKAKELAELYPGHLYYQSAGETHDRREIPQLLLGDSPKCLIVTGGIHGRESVNPVLLLRMAEEYALLRRNEPEDPTQEDPTQSMHRKLLFDYSICFLPLMNPDGYEIALYGFSVIRNPLLRHTLQMTGISHEEWKCNGRGVDINRNFPSRSFLPRANMQEAASENETKALIQVFGKFPESVGYIDFHSRGKIIYYYRNALPFFYNRRGKRMAKHFQEFSGYALGKRSDEAATKSDGGNSVNYYSETFLKLALTVETVEDEAGFPLDVEYQEKTYHEIRRIPLEYLVLARSEQ